MLLDFGRANLLDKVSQVLDKVKTGGLIPTIKAVRSKLDHSLPSGYSNSGIAGARENVTLE
jgi:hypothetical protein